MKFKIGDKVRVVADEKRLGELGLQGISFGDEVGIITVVCPTGIHIYGARFMTTGKWSFDEQDLELAEPERTFVGHPEGVLEVKEPGWKDSGGTGPPIRTFESGATRDTDQGKLDYVKALSPIVLRRYVQYLDKHRLQSDGSYRDFDNWKQGIPEEAYVSGGGRHFMDTWLLTEGYATEDNHGPVEIEDALCAQLFNIMGRLHEILGDKLLYLDNTDRTEPVEGGY